MKKQISVCIFIILLLLTACNDANLTYDIKTNETRSEETEKFDTTYDERNKIIIKICEEEFNLNDSLIYKDVVNLSENQLRTLRNAYFAKHSYEFRNIQYKNEFNQYDWYKPIYEDVGELLTDSDKMNINLILKLEKNFESLFNTFTFTENELIGFWNQGACVGSGYSNTYCFYENRKFVYHTSEMNGEERVRTSLGSWYVLNNKLYLKIKEKEVLVEGELVSVVGSTATDYQIIDAKLETQKVDPNQIMIYDLNFEDEKIEKDYYFGVLIEDNDYYRLSQNPKDRYR